MFYFNSLKNFTPSCKLYILYDNDEKILKSFIDLFVEKDRGKLHTEKKNWIKSLSLKFIYEKDVMENYWLREKALVKKRFQESFCRLQKFSRFFPILLPL